jgi:teichuronic acid biosynthesis glycosyltransferase TuaC
MWPTGENPRYGIFVKREVDALIDAGLRCDVLFVHGYRTRLAYPLAALMFLAENFRRRFRYSLVHVHSGEAVLAARFYWRAPMLVTYHGDDLLGTPNATGYVSLAHRVRRAMIRQHARLLSASLVQSREMRSALSPRVQDRNMVMSMGVNRALFRPRDRDESRRSLGWDSRERVALFVADPAVEGKRYWLAAAACQLAGRSLGGIRLRVAKSVDPDEMPVVLSAADCLLLTSSTEGSPVAVKEALACNLPVVTTAPGDVREMLERVEPSWICDATPASLAAALVECLQEPRRSNGHQASESMDQDRIRDRLLDVYAKLEPATVGGTSPRAGSLEEPALRGRPLRFRRRRQRDARPRGGFLTSDSSFLTTEHCDPAARVLFVTNMWPHAEDGGYGIFVKRQIDSLIAAGLHCDVLFLRGYRSSLAYPLAAMRFLVGNWRGRRYDLVHGHGGETALSLRFYWRAPVLISYCGDDLLGTPRADGTVPPLHKLRRGLLRQHSRTLPATVTKSQQMEKALPPSVRKRNVVIPNGVDGNLFAPLAREEARTLLGWDGAERVVLFAANPNVERKRHWLAKAACERASEMLENVRLHVAMRTPPHEMPIVMNASDCLLLTSSIEGSPNVVKEALACNLPVVATDVGDIRKLLSAVDPSWICSDAVDEIAEALVDCLVEQRRSNGRETFAWLTLPAIANRVLALHRSLAPSAVVGSKPTGVDAPSQGPLALQNVGHPS